MARKFSESVDSSIIETPFGHEVSYVYNTQQLLAEPFESSQRICDINCHNVSTSWVFEVEIYTQPDGNKAEFHVSLMRVDYLDTPVDAMVRFQAYYANGTILSDPLRPLRKNKLSKGGLLCGVFELTVRFPKIANILTTKSYILFTVTILNCHSEKTKCSETFQCLKMDILPSAKL